MANRIGHIFVWILAIGSAFDVVLGVRNELRLGDSTGIESACKSRVENFGYPCEEHTVTTQDGYILSLQRIPNGRSGSTLGSSKTPVLLQHGLFMDGITWLLNLPDESLGYILADNGYDVWIANSRGTIYSQGHITLSANDSPYWNWTWDELVEYDLPANFEYVYQQTGNQRIHYVGHSLGTLIGFASFSEHNLLSMVRSAAMLSPIAYMDQVSSPIARTCAKMHFAEVKSFAEHMYIFLLDSANSNELSLNKFVLRDYYKLGYVEFDPKSEDAQILLKPLCKLVDCFNLMTSFTGPNCCLNSSAIGVFLGHEPQPTSTKNLMHLAQMVRDGTITKYNYDNDDENMSHYGQVNPPAYNISNVPDDLPLFLSYGGADELSDVKDVLHLLNSLHSHDSDKLTVQYRADYAHADFVMAVNAKEVVYEPLMAFFKLQCSNIC